MRKIFLIGVLIVFFIMFLLLLSFGFKLGPIKIMSYDEIRNMNINEKVLLSELDNKSTVVFENKEKELKQTINNYQSTKAEYNRLLNKGTIKEDAINNYINIYNFNEIWKLVQSYAKEKSIILNLEIEQNNSIPTISPNYGIFDLEFFLNGNYINITDFIYSIEDDDRLSFEINNFEMVNGTDGLEAKFKVNSVPINLESINE